MHVIYVRSLNDKICIVWTVYSCSQEKSKMIAHVSGMAEDRNMLEGLLGELGPTTHRLSSALNFQLL